MSVHRVDDLPASLVDQFEILGELGRGSTSVVYRARRLIDGESVALKVLRREVASGVPVERFLREIQLESRFAHPHIVPVLSSGEADGIPYCVMPLCEGESLRARLDRERELPVDQTVRIVTEVASALAHAHAHGVVHRDVKPENIFLAQDRAMVLDFGIARALSRTVGDRLTESGVTVGTPAYMSPEQASGDQLIDPRSDVYSLACVAYEMLTGDPPFTGRSAQVVIARHLRDTPSSARLIRTTLPTGIDYALSRALAKSPADRFASATEFTEALNQPPPDGWDTKADKPARRHRKPVAAALAVISAILFFRFGPIGRAVPLETNRIVLFPLADVRSMSDREAGWDVALAINSSLDRALPLRGIDGWQYLSASTRADAGLLTNAVQLEVARSRQARWYVSGTISRRADSAMVKLNLYDAQADTLVGSETGSGAGDAASIIRSGLRATALLLPRILDPGRRMDLTSLLDREPGALALWMQGERQYRRSHFAEALDLLQRATAEDSLLAVATVRAAQAASWESRPELARRLIHAALRHRDLLGPATYSVANGFRAYLDGEADLAIRLLDSARVLLPDDAAPSMLLGEVYHHLMPPVAAAESLAQEMFQDAFRRDTSFTPAIVHLAESALLNGNSEQASRNIRHLQAVRSDTTLLRELDLIASCVSGSEIDWAASLYGNADAVIQAAQQLAVAGRYPECAKSAFRAVMAVDSTVPAFRWHALLGLQGLLVSQNRGDSARLLLDSALATNRAVMALYPIDLVVGAPTAGRGPEIAAFAESAYGPGYERSSPQTRWVMALWHESQGDASMVQRIAASLRQRADSTDSRRDRLIADAVDAHALLAGGDTTGAIAAFRALRPNAPHDSLLTDLFESLAPERITLARLLLARGDPAGAQAVASSMDHPQSIMNLLFLRESLIIREAAAVALGHQQSAAMARARLRAMALGLRQVNFQPEATRQ